MILVGNIHGKCELLAQCLAVSDPVPGSSGLMSKLGLNVGMKQIFLNLDAPQFDLKLSLFFFWTNLEDSDSKKQQSILHVL